MEIRLVKQPTTWAEVQSLADAQFGEMVKAAVGGELNSDEEALLLEDGSRQEHLWGINIYPAKSGEDRIEFDSMINVRPSQNNRSRGVDDPATRAKILEIVTGLIR